MSSRVISNSESRAKLSMKLKQPNEHGIVVIFALASLLALFFDGNLVGQALTQLTLWLMLLSLQNKRQLIVLTLCAACINALSNLGLSIWLLLVCGGMLLTLSLKSGSVRLYRELVGTAGAILTPLVAALLVSGETIFFVKAATVMTAAVALSTAMIHLASWCQWRRIQDLRLAFTLSTFAAIAMLCLASHQPMQIALALAPFVLQAIWLVKRRKASFKQLGQIEAITLLWVAILIILQRFAVF